MLKFKMKKEEVIRLMMQDERFLDAHSVDFKRVDDGNLFAIMYQMFYHGVSSTFMIYITEWNLLGYISSLIAAQKGYVSPFVLFTPSLDCKVTCKLVGFERKRRRK